MTYAENIYNTCLEHAKIECQCLDGLVSGENENQYMSIIHEGLLIEFYITVYVDQVTDDCTVTKLELYTITPLQEMEVCHA